MLSAGLWTEQLAVFLVGGAVAGAGAGLLFKSAVGNISARASGAKRSEALASLFLMAYLGLVVPSLLLGLATRYVDPVVATGWFGGIVVAGLLVLIAAGRRVWSEQ